MNPKYGKTILPVNLEKGLPGVYWANYFGKRLVESIGGSKLKSSPNARVIELPNGGVLILVGDSPVNPNSKYFQNATRIRQHLGDVFYPESKDEPS
jgi:hypothetical protein